MSDYPLFAPPARRATLKRYWKIQLPEEWAEHFRSNPPGVMTSEREGPAWNLYRSIESSAFHHRAGQYPLGFIEPDAAGIFAVPRELRIASVRPGEPLVLIGYGMWLRIYPLSVLKDMEQREVIQ